MNQHTPLTLVVLQFTKVPLHFTLTAVGNWSSVGNTSKPQEPQHDQSGRDMGIYGREPAYVGS